MLLKGRFASSPDIHVRRFESVAAPKGHKRGGQTRPPSRSGAHRHSWEPRSDPTHGANFPNRLAQALEFADLKRLCQPRLAPLPIDISGRASPAPRCVSTTVSERECVESGYPGAPLRDVLAISSLRRRFLGPIGRTSRLWALHQVVVQRGCWRSNPDTPVAQTS
jgi:hypothetical protein